MAFEQKSLTNYNRNSYWQKIVNLQYADFFIQSITYLLQNLQLSIADYGCSEGANSVLFFNSVIQHLRANSIACPIQITHTDLPENDWTSLNRILTTSSTSYLNHPLVYSATIGRSFYNQLFPSNSIDIGYSAFSFHYSSKEAEFEAMENYERQPNVRRKAYLDMCHVLNLRIKELKPGGCLFALIGCQTEEKAVVTEAIVWEAFEKMIENGFLTKEEMTSIKWASIILEKGEWEQVIEDCKEKAEVVNYSYEKCISPYYTDYLEDQDLEKFVEGFSGFLFVLLENPIRNCLKRDDKENSIRSLWEELKKAVRNHVAETFFHVVLLVLRKKAEL